MDELRFLSYWVSRKNNYGVDCMLAMHAYSNNNTGNIDMLLKLPGVMRYRHSDLCLIPLESFPIPESVPFLAEVESE